jgi:hypothetical protein
MVHCSSMLHLPVFHDEPLAFGVEAFPLVYVEVFFLEEGEVQRFVYFCQQVARLYF